MQYHSMLLWAPPSDAISFREVVDQAYTVLCLFKEFGMPISPNFLPAHKKSAVKPFDMSYEGLEQLIQKSTNKERGKVFLDLGYHFSFFSSLKDEEACGISLRLGVTNPKFTNVMVVDFPETFDIYNPEISDKVAALFTECAEVLSPFWGGVINLTNKRRFNGLWNEKSDIPSTVHWLNFFGKDVIQRVGLNNIEKIPFHTLKKVKDGFMLQLQDRPIDDEKEDDVLLQSKIQHELKLF